MGARLAIAKTSQEHSMLTKHTNAYFMLNCNNIAKEVRYKNKTKCNMQTTQMQTTEMQTTKAQATEMAVHAKKNKCER